MPEQRSGNWTIELRVYPIPEIGYFGGHMFWVLKDPDGNVREELHFFGKPGTELHFSHREEKHIRRDNRYMRGSLREPLLRYSAPYQDILRRWKAGQNIGELLEARPHFDYPSEWDTIRAAAGDGSIANSNAGAYTIGRAMLPELVRKEKSTKIPTPGWGMDLLEYDYPGIYPESPGETQPKIDKRPDFYNETWNEQNKREAAPAAPVELASYRYAPSDGSRPKTVTPAMRMLNAAKADDTFTTRYLKGDHDAVDRMHALHRAAYPEPEAVVGPRVRPEAPDTFGDAFPGGTRDLTGARQALEAAKSDSGFVKRYLDGDRSAFDRMQSLIQAAYPEPAEAGERGGAGEASSDTANGANSHLAPWFSDALAANEVREAGVNPTLAGWLDDWRDEPWRRRG